VSDATHMATPGALGPVLDQLEALGRQASETENLTPSEQMSVCRWKPPEPPRLPALWHWLQEGPPPEMRDQNRLRDIVVIAAYIGVRYSNQRKDLERLERLTDAYRDTVDPELWKTQPLNGTVTWAKRLGMRFVAVEFNQIELLAAEFPIEVWLDRQLVKSTTN
jgi:hypothetical protein